mgnify:CR=1 FL=1
MEKEKINLNDVIDSLSEQSRSKDLTIAYKDALLRNRDKKIKELEYDLEQLSKEHIKQMDEEAPKKEDKK